MRTYLLLILLALAAGSAVAATLPGPTDGVIQGCVRKDTVLVVVPPDQCKTLGQALSWNMQGPAGVKGDPGSALSSIEDMNGVPCTLKGGAGAVAVSTASDGQITFRCASLVQGPILRVNEIMTASPTSAASEFVELVNVGNARADLGGYRLVYRSATGSSDETLATVPTGTGLDPGARFVFGGTTFWGTSNVTYNSGLASTGGGVGLRNSSGQLLDSVGYGSATNAFVEGMPAIAPKAGTSIARLPDGHDANVNASDFSATSPPTPGAPNR